MAEMFPLFKNNDKIEDGISDKCKSILSQCNNPHIICFYGDARLGKSTKLNQIINGIKKENYYSLQEPFKTKLEIHTTQTKGCDFFGPVKIKELIDRNDIDINELEGFDRNMMDDELFFVDTEGLKSIGAVTNTCIAGILTILQIASIKILYIATLDNEKLEDVAKNSKLSNILKLFNSDSETIVLIRDVPVNDQCNSYDQINEDLKQQKETFLTNIGEFFDKLHTKRPICELLPSYELAKKDKEDFSNSYKMQMNELISTFLINIKNNNINGIKLIEIINELIDIFKQVDNIEELKNTGDGLNKVLIGSFEQKVKKFYLEINNQINQYNYEIIKLENKNEEIKDYLIKYIKDELKEIWDIYYDLIKKEIDDIIEKYRLKLNNDILNASKKIKENITTEVNSILKLSDNKEIDEYLSKYNFSDEINKNDVDILTKEIIDNFFIKFEKEFKCFPDEYKTRIQNHLEENLDAMINFKIKSMKTRESYLINIVEDIKNKVSNAFVFNLLKSNKEEIEGNLELKVLKQQIQLYIAQNNIIAADKEDFQKKLDELYEEIKIKLKERIDSIQKGITIEKFKEIQLKGRSIIDGMYLIKPMSCPNKVVHMENNNLIVWDFKNENKQKFEIKYDSFHRCYTIQNVENGQYLTYDDSSIFFAKKNNDANQQWHIVNNDSGGYEIILEKNKKLMQVEDNANNGTKVTCQDKKGKPNQIFNFESTQKTTPPPTPTPVPQPQPQPQIIRYFPIPNFHGPFHDHNSIVDALKSVGCNSSREYREQIGRRNNIPGVPHTQSYNDCMLNLMKKGKLIIP